MLALAAWRDTRCGQCGGDLAETTSADNDGTPGRGRYVPVLPLHCHRCEALAASEEAYSSPEVKHPHTYLHRVELRPPRAWRTTYG